MLKVFLYPFSIIYGIIIFFRNRFYDLGILKSKDFNVPVISVGNITVGGTGKTTHIEYLAGILKEHFRVAVLSRGYKRKTKGFLWVEPDTPAIKAGDEPAQIKRKFPDVTIAVCENRLKGLEKIFNSSQEQPPDAVLLDDAYQHRRITPGINILLIDYNAPILKDKLLPAGRLREGTGQIRRAGIIVFTKCPMNELTPIKRRLINKQVDLKPYQQLFFSTYEYDKLTPVFTENYCSDKLHTLQSSFSALIVTGIANPKLIYNFIEQFAEDVLTMAFPDHHYYSDKDIALIMSRFESINSDRKIIVTTEKDAVRLRDMAGLPELFKQVLYYLPVRVKFMSEEEKLFDKKILKYVGENKSNRKLYKKQV